MSERMSPQRVNELIIRKVQCGMSSCSADIYHLLDGFLARQEFQSFLQVNKHVYSEYVGYRFISLNRKLSLLYVENEQFRDRVLALIINPRRQLALNLSQCLTISDVSKLADVHTLNLSGCRNIVDVSALVEVTKLNLTGCSKVTDVSALGGVTDLNLTRCINITDVSALGGVTTLNLLSCCMITKVNALGGVTTLYLSRCSKIIDVGALGGVTTLNLSKIYLITSRAHPVIYTRLQQ